MSDILNDLVSALNENLDTDALKGSIKLAITDEGAVMIDDDGIRIADEDADCTLGTDAETMQGLLAGDVDPTSAFMMGKLKVDGDMGVAMSLSAALA